MKKSVSMYREVSNHWNALRNKYTKAQKILLAKPKSVSAAKPRTTNFVYYHQMDSFLSKKSDNETE